MSATVHDLNAERAARTPLRVYLAGPMRGRPRYNFDAFAEWAEFLRGLGYDVTSPAEHDLDEGFDPDLPLHEQDFDLPTVLLWDLAQVATSDLVVVMPGWRHSKGACAEVAVAEALGVTVLDVLEMVATAQSVGAA